MASAAHSRWIAGIGVLVCLGFGCGPDESTSTGTVAPDVSDVHIKVCPPSRLRSDGACCPVGTTYRHDSGECPAIGPPACAKDLQADPKQCSPRWCADWRTPAKAACDPEAPNCWLEGRACTDDELAAGQGCRPGWWPKPGAGGACVPVGSGPLLSAPLDAEAAGEDGLEPIGPLPPVAVPKWCFDDVDWDNVPCSAGVPGCRRVPRACGATEVDHACAAGTWRPPGETGPCVAVGVKWICPPGFVVDKAAPHVAKGLPACKPDPADCKPGKWGGVTSAKVLFVDDDAAPGGDGSQQKPHAAIQDALAVAVPGATIAIADGTYNEELFINKPVTLRGRCATHVVLNSKSPTTTIRVQGAAAALPVKLEGLQIRSASSAIWVTNKLAAHGKRLWINRPWHRGVLAFGQGRFVLEQSLISAPQKAPGKNGDGTGLSVEKGGRATLREVRIESCASRGIVVAHKGSHLDAVAVAVDGTRMPPGAKLEGDGITVVNRGSLRLRGARLQGNARVAIAAGGPEVRAAIEGVQVLDHGASAMPFGMIVGSGARAVAAGLEISGGLGEGIVVHGNNASLRAGGVLIEGGRPRPNSAAAYLEGASRLELRASHITQTHGLGVLCRLNGSELLIADSIVGAGIDPPGQSNRSWGIAVSSGCVALLRRVRLWNNAGTALAVSGRGTRVEARGLLLDGTRGGANLTEWDRPTGILAFNGAVLWLLDARLSDNVNAGLTAEAGGLIRGGGVLMDHGQPLNLRLSAPTGEKHVTVVSHGAVVRGGGQIDLFGARSARMLTASVWAITPTARMRAVGWLIDHTLHNTISGAYGLGILLEDGAEVDCLSCELVANRSTSAMVRYGASLILQRSVARATRGQKWLNRDRKEDVLLADGVVARENASLTLDRCLLTDNPRAGVLLTDGASAAISGTASTGNGYGLVQQSGSSVKKDSNGWWDNVIANEVQGSNLSVPVAPQLAEE